VCVDVVVQWLPGKRSFRIQDSNAFLACSLSLSFGVMIFSALNSMLPSASRYLVEARIPRLKAGAILMGSFVAGFAGIQIVSRLMHRFMPSHVVDCDHTHDGDTHNHRPSCDPGRHLSLTRRASHPDNVPTIRRVTIAEEPAESTPLLLAASEPPPAVTNGHLEPPSGSDDDADPSAKSRHTHFPSLATLRRRSIVEVRDRLVSFVKDTKSNCDQFGPCYGYSDPCGQECFKHVGTRFTASAHQHHNHQPHLPRFLRTTTSIHYNAQPPTNFGSLPEDLERGPDSECVSPTSRDNALSGGVRTLRDATADHLAPVTSYDDDDAEDGANGDAGSSGRARYDSVSPCSGSTLSSEPDPEPHHHHVPANGFLALGLQTVLAIALHKFPEGFITYATNHANPTLGFNVFMALLVHNIAEGFAMALPLYLALGSRRAAVAWASALGGLTQPAGAALAALWFRLAGRAGLLTPSHVFYACLFAATAGTMTSVALQLFVESLSLDHNRNLSIAFAFLGMTLLGVSNALVEH